jgi:hypothetical protein
VPLQKLQFRPGVNREGTTLSNEGGWFESEKARWRSGYPEKIGGWQRDSGTYYVTAPTTTFASGGSSTTPAPSTGAFWGTARALWNWLNLTGYNLLSVGTNLKYYIQNSSGGAFNDVTPIRTTNTSVANVFTTTLSTTIQVNDSGYGGQSGDFVTISATSGTVNGVPAALMNAEYQITYLTSNTFSIRLAPTTTVSVAISSSATSITLATTANFPSNYPAAGAIFIGSERITYTGISTNTLTGCTRGTNSTTAVAHSAGESVTISPTSASTSAVTATISYQIITGSAGFTYGTGWGAGGFGGYTPGVGSTVLSGSINSSVTSIALSSVTGFTTTGVVLIGTEQISYTNIASLTLTGCTRGINGSTAASHSAGDAAQLVTGWGSPAPTGLGLGIQLRLWSQSNYGEDLIFNPRGGAMYYWANNSNPNVYDRGQVIKAGTSITLKGGSTVTPDSTCPSVANFIMVSDASRFVFSFGCNDPTGVYATTGQDPLQIRWSDQNSFITWTPAITNQAGGIRLSHGSSIVTAIQTRQEILVLTDAAIYSMQYLGAPYVWSTQLLGDNISIVGPNAMATVNNVTYWMGTDKFYMYSGRVETLPCALRSYVYNDINMSQSFQFFAGTNEGFNEIWWFYCSLNSSTVDKYVIYNHLERTWYYGTFDGVTVRPRTAWLDSPLRVEPTAAIANDTNGTIVYHETGVDNNETGTPLPIESWVQSSDFDIGDGHNFGFVWRLIPDITFDGSTTNDPSADFTVRPRQFPGSNYGASDNPTVVSAQNYVNQRTYNVQQFTEQVYVRIRGRQMAFRVSSNDLGVQWQLGAPRIDVRPDGRR